MDTKRICGSCGAPLAAGAPEGLCPKCLMKAGIGSEAGNPAQAGKEPTPPPLPEEIAKYFPQLQILELLGQGGMGMVYKARQPQLDRLVAVKILLPELSRDPAFAERFTREAKALARLNHPNIVGVYDFGKTGEYYYFLMEYVDGLNLLQMEQASKPLAPAQALAIVPKICDALQYAHEEGIVHRDIKPANILIDTKGRVKIADFGLAKLLGQQPQNFHLTQSKMMLGTPQDMAPEQFEDPQNVDHRVDIYSLGVVFYEMLTGELPMGRFPLPSEKVQVDVRLDEVVLRALARKPELRYQHASEVRTDVESLSAVIDKLPPHLRRVFGYEYKSKQTLWGLPLVHLSFGVDPATGKARPAKGIIAVGGKATGVVALGGMAIGIFAFGGLSVGFFSVGGLALGLISVGGAAISLLLAYGGLAVAPIAMGGAAIGYYAFGGGAWGAHATGGNGRDPVAQQFFEAWRIGPWLTYFVFALVLVPPLVPALVRVFLRGRSPTPSRTGSTGGPTITAVPEWRPWPILLSATLIVAVIILTAFLLLRSSRQLFYAPGGNTRAPAGSGNASSEASMPAEQIVAQLDWQKLADQGRLLGGVPIQVDGRTALRIENTNDGPLQLSLVKIERPAITSITYALIGEIKYENVQGNGYLEMWNYFPPVRPGLPEGQYFSRTMGEINSGPMARISDTSNWRPFLLRFDRTGSTSAPTRLELNIFLPGRGVVFLGAPRLAEF